MLRQLRIHAKTIVAAALVCGVLAGLAGWWTAINTEQHYTAQAIFEVIQRSPDVDFVSHSKAIVAEQTARQLDAGLTATGSSTTIASTTIAARGIEVNWVVGPGYGRVAFTVRAQTPAAAREVAQTVYRLGKTSPAALFRADVRPAKLKADRFIAPMQTVAPRSRIIVGAGVVGAIFGAAIAAIVARPHRIS